MGGWPLRPPGGKLLLNARSLSAKQCFGKPEELFEFDSCDEHALESPGNVDPKW